jgi:hypothetical protein
MNSQGGVARIFRPLLYRPQRTLVLPVVAIVVGLAIAVAGLFRTAPAPLTAVPPGYVALVNQKGILMNDFIAQTQLETSRSFAESTPAERRHVLHEMIDEEVLVQRGLVLDLPETTNEVRGSMVSALNAQVAAPILAYVPTDAELRGYYDKNRQNYTGPGSMLAHDLVLHVGGFQNADQTATQAQADATEAVYQLRAGTSLDYISSHFGFANSGRMDDNEQPDFAAKLHLGDRLYAVAAQLRDGEISDPVLDSDGMHILVMVRHEFPKVSQFGAVRDRVYLDWRSAQTRQAQEENAHLLRAQAQILIAPGQAE